MLLKECFVSIKKNIRRYISLLLIVLLGVGFYAGIKATSPDMKDTLNAYYKKSNIYNLELISTLGIYQEDLDKIQKEGYQISGTYSFDTVIKNKEENVAKIWSYDPKSDINKLTLLEGRLPQTANECLIEKNRYTKQYKLNDHIIIESENLKNNELTIVGFIESPLYISMERGSTNLLSGTIHYYMYIPVDNFQMSYYTNAYITLNTNQNYFSTKYKDQVKQNTAQLESITKELGETRYQTIIEEATQKLAQAEADYQHLETSANELLNNPYLVEEAKMDIQNKLQETKNMLLSYQEEIKNIKPAKWYVLDLEANTGFYQYEKDTERITNIAKIFPLVFFIVAILICLTTMTRMVEEERSQIGTLKSLGYNDTSIMLKYILYAITATITGSLIGVIIGFNLIPKIIFNMYKMMYRVPDFQSNFSISLTLQGTIIATICTLVATLFACLKTMKEVPAELLRPTAPKAGKRVFLEKVTVVWNHLKFSHKVTVRNVFRYKKKFLMTIIGISGCTGLILAGFGLKDCITNMVPNQYEKIFSYQASIMLKDNLTKEEQEQSYQNIKKLEEVTDSIRIRQEPVELQNKTTNQTIQLIIPETNLNSFIKLQNRNTKQSYQNTNQLIVTEKLASLLNLKKNDTLDLSTTNQNYSGTIGGITENYLYHYIYMPKEMAKEIEYNTILLKTEPMTEAEEKEFAAKLKQIPEIASLTFNSSTRNVFDSTMKNFSSVALVLIISAGLLACVVLYNLESINISERKREIATLKVLGFYDKEVYKYISRETIILSTIGIAFGMIIGKVLTNFIIKTCELDMIMFDPTISISSYLYAILITLVFIIVVSLITHFTLKKIDMIESLKSVE